MESADREREASGLVRARWELRPRDGSAPVRGDLRALPGPIPSSAVVLCHGFKGFKDWGFFPTLARALARRGHAVLSFNLSGSGVGADEVDFSDLEGFARQTHSRNLEEIRMVINAVTQGRLFPQRPRRVGLFGHSRGGGEAVLAAAEDGGVHALVTWAAIARVQRWSEEQIAAWQRGETVFIPNARTGQQMPVGPEYWRDLDRNRTRLDVLGAASRLEMPWLIVHGQRDTSVGPADAHALFQAAGDNAELLLIEDADHTFGAVHPYAGPTPELQTAVEATLDWFDQQLR